MPNLNRNLLADGHLKIEASASSRLKPVRILLIGDGNFLRAFADWMIDVANGAGLFNGQVTMAQPLARGIAELMKAQDCLYTVLLRGVQNGVAVDSRRVVSCVEKVLNPYAGWDAMLATVQDSSLRFVISNTTEAGIAYADEPLQEGQCPNSFPAKVTALLLARFKALGGTALVDVTPAGMQRDPDWLRGLATASGLHIVMGSGWYRTAYYKPEVLIDKRSVDFRHLKRGVAVRVGSQQILGRQVRNVQRVDNLR